ncbi:hypothetical protein [Ectopseudomonas oleovorans]|jgi:hypothetical protein|uniref:hypothetical protein n=1 Tax=Ectopseudomonas oleovorans TaxID=301 RepID=UPI001B7C7EF0|nr:hypothetical protein [Burkholderiaceae bacterium]HPU08901.1 hypothetical protein [Ottowia sp.]
MHASTIEARQPAGVAARALWLLRWLLVLVLVWDQVSSPLHQHRHDSGVDAQWLTASAHGAQATTPHLEDDDHDLRASHAVLAVRPQLDLRSLALGDDPDHGFASSQNYALAQPGPAEAQAEGVAAFARPHSTHRSLPPAGRAPPLHT